MALSDIYQKASLVQIPSGYKSGTLYSVVPNTSSGDFTIDSDADATRVNKDGLVETTVADQARLNYDPSNPQDPHLLLEPTRTNSLTYSEDFTNIDFQNNLTVTTDNIIAPNGSLTADKTTQTSGGYLRETVSVSNGTTYSFSVFLKKGDLRYAVVRSLFSQNGTTPANSNNVFDLDNGSVIYTGTNVISASIEAYSNDWYRCSFVSLASGTSSASFIDFYFSSSSSSTQSSGTAGFGYGWGMQLEAGSYPTSYIPTTIAVTRTANNAHLLNQTLITDYPFTVYTNAKIEAVGNAIFSLNNTSSQNYYLVFYFPNSTQIGLLRRDLSNSDNDFYNFSYSVGDTIKVAVAFISATEYKLYINGTEIADVTSGTSIPFNHDDISLGQFRITGDTGTRNSINEFMLFNEALTDAELIALTS